MILKQSGNFWKVNEFTASIFKEPVIKSYMKFYSRSVTPHFLSSFLNLTSLYAYIVGAED